MELYDNAKQNGNLICLNEPYRAEEIAYRINENSKDWLVVISKYYDSKYSDVAQVDTMYKYRMRNALVWKLFEAHLAESVTLTLKLLPYSFVASIFIQPDAIYLLCHVVATVIYLVAIGLAICCKRKGCDTKYWVPIVITLLLILLNVLATNVFFLWTAKVCCLCVWSLLYFILDRKRRVMENFAKKKSEIYINSANYEEEYVHVDGKECYIFFSSNGLYNDSTVEEIEKTLLEMNRYEWKNLAKSFKYHKNLGKIIYVRDIYKAFYLYGINHQLNSIEQVIIKLKELTIGYEVTTVGISSGGYMAVISAIALRAKRAFCFSGQYDITECLSESDLAHCKGAIGKRKYINIVDLIKQNPETPIYYFCPIGCRHDYDNYMRIKYIKSVRTFLFPDKIHAATVYPFNFPDVLFKTNYRLDKLNRLYLDQTINKNIFYMRTVTIRGFFILISYIWRTRAQIEILKMKWDV